MNLKGNLGVSFLTQKADICLLNMPISFTCCPSIGLGILRAILQQAHFRASIIYANLLFAEKIGFTKWQKILSFLNHTTNIREWIFSHCVFPQKKENIEEYLDLFIFELKSRERYYSKVKYKDNDVTIRNELLLIRIMAEEFINELTQLILAKEPKIVGCSSVGSQNLASLAILKKIKEIAPNIITIMGGPNCFGELGIAMAKNFSWIDFVCSGEADDTIVPLCKSIVSQSYPTTLDSLPNGIFNQTRAILFSTKTEAQNKCQLYGITKNLNNTPPPDYSDYFITLKYMSYKKQIKPVLLIEASRGCWWGKCTFCALCAIKSFRVKDYELVLQHMQQLSQRYGVQDIFFVDAILPMAYFKTLVPALTMSHKYNIFFEVKANLQEQHLKQLSKANIRWVQPGIEALNDKLLKLMNKGTTAVINLNFLKKAVENGINVMWALLANFPGENIEWFRTLADELPLFHHLPPPPRRFGISDISALQ